MRMTETPPPCSEGHVFEPDHVIVGWKPCLCAPGHTGHRSYWCRDHGIWAEPRTVEAAASLIMHQRAPDIVGSGRAAIGRSQYGYGWFEAGVVEPTVPPLPEFDSVVDRWMRGSPGPGGEVCPRWRCTAGPGGPGP